MRSAWTTLRKVSPLVLSILLESLTAVLSPSFKTYSFTAADKKHWFKEGKQSLSLFYLERIDTGKRTQIALTLLPASLWRYVGHLAAIVAEIFCLFRDVCGSEQGSSSEVWLICLASASKSVCVRGGRLMRLMVIELQSYRLQIKPSVKTCDC